MLYYIIALGSLFYVIGNYDFLLHKNALRG